MHTLAFPFWYNDGFQKLSFQTQAIPHYKGGYSNTTETLFFFLPVEKTCFWSQGNHFTLTSKIHFSMKMATDTIKLSHSKEGSLIFLSAPDLTVAFFF